MCVVKRVVKVFGYYASVECVQLRMCVVKRVVKVFGYYASVEGV